MVKGGGIAPGFSAIWGYRQTPAAHAEHAHRFFLPSTFLGLTGPRRWMGQKDSPFLTTSGGGMTPQIY